MRDAAEPLTDSELAGLAASAFRDLANVVLAVSGGADSLCLLLLAEAAARVPEHSPRFIAATVDHGWRAEAADEARWVGDIAGRHGVPHRVLTWDGPKPTTGRQEAARTARYGLLADLVTDFALPGPAAIATGHHSDDQAETFLMRLARGSGIDGLSAMAPRRTLSEIPGARRDICLVRPFLDIPKARLVATLQARGLAWIDDPGNSNTAFERVRIREALATLADLGVTASAIARSAARLTQSRSALDAAADTLLREIVDFHDGAMASIAGEHFDAAPADIRLRLLQRLWTMFGGPDQTPRRSQLDDLIARLDGRAASALTLAGAAITRSMPAGPITLLREPGRTGLPELKLQPGQVAVWDHRFEVELSHTACGPVTIRPLREGDALPCTSKPFQLPRRAILTLPAAWSDTTLLGVLHPAFPRVSEVQARHLHAPPSSAPAAGPPTFPRC